MAIFFVTEKTTMPCHETISHSFICFLLFLPFNGHVKIDGTGSPHPNSVLELDGGTDKGLTLPKHTFSEMNAMSNAPEGTIIYCTDNDKLYVMKNNAWTFEMKAIIKNVQKN